MKRLIYILAVIFIWSCEDVIEVGVPSEEPRLIIDALVRVDTTQTVTNVSVKVMESSSFFDSLQPVELDQITLAGQVLLQDVPGSGIYSKDISTQTLMQEDLFLAIDYNDQIFVGLTDFATAVPIDSLWQGPGGLIDNETELTVRFTDNAESDDYYLFDFDLQEFLTTRDQFYQGQSFEFSYFYENELAAGTEVEVSLMGATEEFYRYMEKIIEQSNTDLNLFDTPAITVKGNILNATDIQTISDLSQANLDSNFPLGYFAVVQEYKRTITIE